MTTSYEQYTEEMRREFGYSATWLPNAPLRIGDVGFFRRDRFERVTSLRAMGVAVPLSPPGESSDLEYLSAGHVELSWRTDAGVGSLDQIIGTAPTADASTTVSVLFGRAHAVVFQALASRVQAVRDLTELASQLRPLVESGKWQRDFAVITEVIQTGPSAVLVSSQANARADFRVKTSALAGPCVLARASANLGIVSASGVSVKIAAPNGLTPLFRACAFRSRLRRPPKLTYRGDSEAGSGDDSPRAAELDFGPLDYADALPPATMLGSR